jgi:hypothetical protein
LASKTAIPPEDATAVAPNAFLMNERRVVALLIRSYQAPLRPVIMARILRRNPGRLAITT